jgi:hypothetical protein
MEINLEQLKKNFVAIKEIRNKIITIFQILETHLNKLKQSYSEFIVNNKQNLFVFGLDSFQFQSKLIDIEYDDMKRLFLAINNRMYCEYYKLYKIISDYVKENIIDIKILDIVKVTNIFPVYKDLEPYKQYNFEIIQEIHENIILLLYGINEFIINKEHELDIHHQKQETGLNINNFVTAFNYSIIMVKQKGILFISYIQFFHNLHTKYLQRFSMKMNLMYSQVTHDIRFDDTPKTSEIKKNELISNYQDDNIDKTLIKQIKKSLDDSDSNDSDYSVLSPSLVNPSQINININNLEIENKVKHNGILKKMISPMVNSMKLFKSQSKKDIPITPITPISCDSGEGLTNIILENQEHNLVIGLTENINKKNNDKKEETFQEINVNPISIEDEAELQKTLSQENMFLEITNQCNKIINIRTEIDKDSAIEITNIIQKENHNDDISVLTVNSNIDKSTDTIDEPTDTIEQSTDNIEQSPDNIEQSTDTIEQSNNNMEQPTDTIEQSNNNMEQPTDNIEQSNNNNMEQPTDTIDEPTDTIDENINKKTEPKKKRQSKPRKKKE